jgi:hypothetical protein
MRHYFCKLLGTDKPIFHAFSKFLSRNASHPTLSPVHDFLAHSLILHAIMRSPPFSSINQANGKLLSTKATWPYFATIHCRGTRYCPCADFLALIRMAEVGTRFQDHGTTSWLMSGDLPAPKTEFGAPYWLASGWTYLQSWTV